MATRIDSASRRIAATPSEVYAAFATPGAMERWIAPRGMDARMLHFDFRAGGSYRLRLTYRDASGGGKTSQGTDEANVKLTRVEPGRCIGQEIVFDSQDAAFAGVMRMTWTFEADADGTLVTVQAEDVPAGIRGDDHEAAMASSLQNLAAFVEG